MGPDLPRFYEFDKVRVDTLTGDVVRADGKGSVRGKHVEVLALFLANPMRVIEVDEIKRVWGYQTETYNVHNAISKIRAALDGPRKTSCSYIKTVPGRGYKFIPESPRENEPLRQPEHDHIRLREKPTILEWADAVTMAVAYDFYWAGFNDNGKGIRHHYRAQVCGGAHLVLDGMTRLMWERSGSGFLRGGYRAADEYVTRLNSKTFGGFGNWRLPTLEEALSLMTPWQEGDGPPQASHPATGDVFHLDMIFEKMRPLFIWTCDVLVDDASRGWCVNYWRGSCLAGSPGMNAYVKAVRSLEGSSSPPIADGSPSVSNAD